MFSFRMKFPLLSIFPLFYLNIKSLWAAPSDFDFGFGIIFDQNYKNVEDDVHFYLYTRTNPEEPQQLQVGNKSAIETSAFDASKPTKFMTHGWDNTFHGLNCITVRKAFLAQGDYNVVIVDWANVAKLPYLTACTRIKAVGGHVAKMISFLESQGNNPNNMSLVGHSLGAHVMGLAGYQAAHKLPHIVGLDPAGPAFEKAGPGQGISKEDAHLVEIVHTNADCLDISRSVGHADFYVNGGGPKQPGCGEDANCYCAHARAYVYYSESLMNPDAWLATRCDSYRAFLRGECSDNEVVPFPRWSKDGPTKSGDYFLRTKDSAPFGLGLEGAKAPESEE